MKNMLVALSALMLAVSAQVGADQPVSVDIKRLSMESALRVAQATVEACREEGLQVGVTVVDRGGHPQVVLRDVLAPDLTLTVSRQKAYTAMSFNAATSALQDRSSSSLGNLDVLMFGGGGLPIQAGGVLYGAVGVSGAPTGELDEKCARAGVAAIMDDLEMGGF